MGGSQQEIDALLADVSNLAAETAADIGGGPAGQSAPGPATATLDPADAPVPKRKQMPSSFTTVASASSQRAADPRRILHLEVPVIVILAQCTMPLSRILTFSPGSIIEFEKPSDGLLDLMINNRCVGRGQAVKVGENFGLRINVVGSVKSRVEAVTGD
jgi:flagellar motor switch protein FliN/FliY